ncbi:S8 family serine peptidase [Rothia uropygialis]|uniref:S8 family serine peptidase n=1 Tax=Kocuria sp. 36 TaxID=1415402 RepID=UPI00101C590D|nr:S8 family serine peptidase [Kocuria sp. 36]
MKTSKNRRAPRSRARGCVAAAVGLALTVSFAPPAFSDPIPGQPGQGPSAANQPPVISPGVQDAQGDLSVYVQFRGKGAFEETQPSEALRGGKTQPQAERVQAIASSVRTQSQQVAEQSGGQVLYTTHNAIRGAAVYGNAERIRSLADRDDVVKVSKIVPKKRVNSGSVVDTGTLDEWTQTGQTGKGVTIAVIDSGLDYTHADFGGPGTTEAYDKAKASHDMPSADSGLFDTNKLSGGWDLAGDEYDSASSDASARVPHEDSNPLDCRAGGHGTHVAGTAAGYGVDKNGSTYRGGYTDLTKEDVSSMSIGPGTAPEAKLTSLRVFGCEGSTDLVGAALDRTLDPNGDGDFSDRANIASISIGADFGPSDDPENDIVDALSRQGVLSVIAAGNAGDEYNIYGNPGSSPSALTVANSQGSTAGTDEFEVTGPNDLKGKYNANYSSDFDYGGADPETLKGSAVAGPVDDKYGCEPFSGDQYKDKWVVLDWADDATQKFPCGSKIRFDNAAKAGAKGVILTSDREVEGSGIAGNATIPGAILPKSVVDKLIDTANKGSLEIRLDPGMRGHGRLDSGNKDVLNESSSRGEHGSIGYTKPDVAAPGTAIVSAGVGTGKDPLIMSGTSMATPHTSGIAALVLQKHQNYSPQNIKAVIMNTATHDVKNEGATASVERVGSGRVDALRAVNDDVLVYSKDRPDLVSQSFGVTEVNGDVQTYKRDITVDNTGSALHTYGVSFAGSTSVTGASFSFAPSVSVGPGGKSTITVTATIDPAKLSKELDPATAREQLGKARQYISTLSGRLVLSENGADLRVPLQIAPKPVSDVKATSTSVDFGNGEDSQDVNFKGAALDQNGYTSALGAFQLGATSDRINSQKLPARSVQGMDLQYVGASSNLPEFRAKGKDTTSGKIGFGISTWGPNSALTASMGFEVAIDVDRNGRPDYLVSLDRVKGLDYPVASLHGYKNGQLELLDQQPVNGSWGDRDTNTMDTNAFVLPVDANKIGIDVSDPASEISYRVTTQSWLSQGPVDSTDWIGYNPVSPDLWYSSDAAFNDVLFKDREGAVTAHRGGQEEGKALFLHLHNKVGDLSGIAKGEDGGVAEVLPTRSAPNATGHDPGFKDVPKDYVFHNEIAWLAEKNITTGWPDGTFRPMQPVQRDQMAAFLYRMAGSPQYTPPSTSPFKDVPTNHTFYKEISWLNQQGITKGWSDGTFRPGSPVNRDQMAAFFYRMVGSPSYTPPATSPFKDVPTDYVFYREIAWMADQGITKGWDDGTFRPMQPVQRDQMAAFLFRYNSKSFGNS